MATSEELDAEMMLALAANPEAKAPIDALVQRRWLHQRVSDPVIDGRYRDGAVSHATTVMLANDQGTYDLILATRSRDVATHAHFNHITPSGIFSPYFEDSASSKQEFSVRRNFYREFVEELYDLDEHARQENFFRYSDPSCESEIVRLEEMLGDGRASLTYTGVSVNLLTLRPEVCLLLIIHDPEWILREQRNTFPGGRSLRFNWEYAQRPADVIHRDRGQPDHWRIRLNDQLTPADGRSFKATHLVPNAAAAIHLATEVVRARSN